MEIKLNVQVAIYNVRCVLHNSRLCEISALPDAEKMYFLSITNGIQPSGLSPEVVNIEFVIIVLGFALTLFLFSAVHRVRNLL